MSKRPVPVLLIVAALSVAAGLYASTHLHLQGDVTELVDAEADFLRDYDDYKATFPQHRRLNVIVIDGRDARTARRAEAAMLEGLRARVDLFPNLFAPGADSFLVRHALLFPGVDEVAALVDHLAEAQPALALVARDPSLRGLADLFARAEAEAGSASGLARLAAVVAERARQVGDPLARPVSWAEVALGAGVAPTRRLIVFQGSLEADDETMARDQADVVRTLAQRNGLTAGNGVSIAMTGRGPLSASELESALASIQFAGLLSLAFIVALLWTGLGSLRAIVAVVLTLGSGLLLTSAFAAVTIGSLNVLSLTFAVLFIGLGVDFAIHLILRRVGEGDDRAREWSPVARGLGPTIALCGLTTAIAFLAFWPTGFRGLAELGLISAAGILIAVAMTFTVLPPLLNVLRVLPGPHLPTLKLPDVLVPDRIVRRVARPVSICALVVLVVAAGISTLLRFDFNSLNLQDPDSEAVRTLVSLHEDGTITPYSLTIAAPNLAAADAIAETLRGLPQVAAVRTLRDFIPGQQDEKLTLIDEARILLGPAVLDGKPVAPPDDPARMAALIRLTEAARALAGRPGADGAFSEMAGALTPLGDAAAAKRLEFLVMDDVSDSLALLREALAAEPVSLASLPAELVARESGADGSLRVVALPREDLRDFEALRAFVRAVHEIYPMATGRPALEAGVGEIVVDAFRQAFITAAIAILLVLAVTLRSLADAALVMVPLLLAAAMTAATMVALAIPLNVANVIVLPLLLGMGVDNGIHIVGRYRETASVADVYRSTTPRAVVLSALTTLMSFVSLAFAEHRGMASMGQILAIAIGCMLFATLVVLPALLVWRDQRRLQ